MHDEQIISALRHATVSGRWLRTKCPFCFDRTGKEDKRGALGVDSSSGGYHCFRCGVHGKADLPEDLETEVPEELDTERVSIEQPEDFYPLAGERDSYSLSPAWDYLLGRGISESTIIEAQIGACVGGFFDERIVVPINPNADGDWLGFVARDWTNTSTLRYRYPKGMKRNLLFNHDALFIKTDEPAIVVEGVFDALPYWPNAVACLGKPIKEHVAALMVANRPLAIALDGDAHREGDALAMLLRFEGREAGFVKLPPGADPNSVDPNWLRKAARESINA